MKRIGNLALRGKVNQGPDALFVDAAHEDAVQFDPWNSRRERRINATKDGRKIATGNLPIQEDIQGIEAHVHRIDAGLPQRDRQRKQTSAVRRDPNDSTPRKAEIPAATGSNILSNAGLAAREPKLTKSREQAASATRTISSAVR